MEARDDAAAPVAIEWQSRVMADEALAAGPRAGPAFGIERELVEFVLLVNEHFPEELHIRPD